MRGIGRKIGNSVRKVAGRAAKTISKTTVERIEVATGKITGEESNTQWLVRVITSLPKYLRLYFNLLTDNRVSGKVKVLLATAVSALGAYFAFSGPIVIIQTILAFILGPIAFIPTVLIMLITLDLCYKLIDAKVLKEYEREIFGEVDSLEYDVKRLREYLGSLYDKFIDWWKKRMDRVEKEMKDKGLIVNGELTKDAIQDISNEIVKLEGSDELEKEINDGVKALESDNKTANASIDHLEHLIKGKNHMGIKPIFLKNIFPIDNIDRYKTHFGKHNETEEPLDAWVRDESNWADWQVYTANRDDFNRQYIFSMMQFYHETDSWLFGGIFEVKDKEWIEEDGWKGYKNIVELTDKHKEYIGRLKIYSSYRGRAVRVNFENYYNELEVREILPEKYSGRVFPGYENVELSFSELETLVNNARGDWRTALQSVKGVYMITDTSANKRYIGSAHSEGGVWSRWSDYVTSGHGSNLGLTELLGHKADLTYCRQHFRLFLLERHPMNIGKDEIIARENFWKEILMSRGGYGYNKN